MQLFEDGNTFFEVVCVVVTAFDDMWVTSGATQEVFGDVVDDMRARLKAGLAKGPTSANDLGKALHAEK